MKLPLTRRAALVGLGASALISRDGFATGTGGLRLAPARPFSFDALKAQAARLSRTHYQARHTPDPKVLDQLDYEALGQIRYKSADAPFADGGGPYPVTFFHLGKFSRLPVAMHIITGAASRQVIYSPELFDMPANSPAHALRQGAGFAGFRFQESPGGKYPWKTNDWAAFLGASYFRAIGDLHQYGLSARGISVNAASAKPEEFPDFTEFYIEEQAGDPIVRVYALLEGPSLTGAYRFALQRGTGVTMDVDATLHLRADIERLGIAPLTSMYWFSETLKPEGIDWRPEVHDSDGLALWTGAGERIWRPLNDPASTSVSSFIDTNPRGFGLMQRDRNFDHYLDGVNYQDRPSLWVEPKGAWGAGAVQLIEIPTDDETNDNIVAQWVPSAPAKAGQTLEIGYKLYWQSRQPQPIRLARCVATRIGRGGQPGLPRPQGVRKFVVEFQGEPLENIPFGTKPEAVLSASRGTFSLVFTEAVPDGVKGHWRAVFDLSVKGTDPVEMRLYLRLAGKALSETWAYQYHPF